MNTASTAALLTLLIYLIKSKQETNLVFKIARELKTRERAEQLCRKYSGPRSLPTNYNLTRGK